MARMDATVTAIAASRRARTVEFERRRPPTKARGGRMCLKAAEVGGTDPRFAHLSERFD